ncbi:hypothetical protein [Asanoa sp. NPDC050611]|uniref:hypothetical protein n=1 Tax=Asanoa sp. NPDC050611 TaxID=3157098 RepID=UPI0033E7C9AD
MRLLFPRIARALAGVAALLALVAFASGVSAVAGAGDEAAMVETWRSVGFGTFAALFAYLAVRPAAVGLWVIVLANKLALTIAAVAYGSDVVGAVDSAIWDGALVVLLSAGLTLVLAARSASARRAGPESEPPRQDSRRSGQEAVDASPAHAQTERALN